MPKIESAPTRHDARFKALFNHSPIVEEFLRAVAPEEFVSSIDFSTASQTGGDFVDGSGRSRRADRVWRVRTKDGGEWMYLYLLLEFQSRPDPMMAKRILEYVLALREQAEGESRRRGRARTLPPVLPAVIYCGERPWTAPLDYLDLVEGGSEWLREFQTRQRYALIDLAREKPGRYPVGNAIRALTALFQRDFRPAELELEVDALARALGAPEQEGLRRAFGGFMVWSIEQSRLLSQDNLDKLKGLGPMPELEDVGSIIGRNIDRAFVKARHDSKLEGKLDGLRDALRRQALKKFGADGQGELPGLVAELQDVGQLENALDYVLECSDPDQFARFLRRTSNGG